MNTVLVILIIVAALATVGALIRGRHFLRTAADLSGTGPSVSGRSKQGDDDARDVQAVAVLLVALTPCCSGAAG